MPATPLNTIADRINYLLKEENLSTYEFCKQAGILEQRRAFEYALTKGQGDNVSASFIKLVYNRFKDKVSMIWLMYGDDDNTVLRYINKIKELQDVNVKVSDIISKSYLEIKNIVDESTINKLKKKK